ESLSRARLVMQSLSRKTDGIIFAEQSSRKSCELIVRQTFGGLQSVLILAFEEKHIRPGTGGLEPLVSAHWHRFHGIKCFLCDAEIAVLRDSQLALDLQRVQGGRIRCNGAINGFVSRIPIP